MVLGINSTYTLCTCNKTQKDSKVLNLITIILVPRFVNILIIILIICTNHFYIIIVMLFFTFNGPVLLKLEGFE